jgi:hypothetical protein
MPPSSKESRYGHESVVATAGVRSCSRSVLPWTADVTGTASTASGSEFEPTTAFAKKHATIQLWSGNRESR